MSYIEHGKYRKLKVTNNSATSAGNVRTKDVHCAKVKEASSSPFLLPPFPCYPHALHHSAPMASSVSGELSQFPCDARGAVCQL